MKNASGQNLQRSFMIAGRLRLHWRSSVPDVSPDDRVVAGHGLEAPGSVALASIIRDAVVAA
jgi:hypothetical protein